MKVRSIAPWFGGKRSMADDICAEFGPHNAYWDIPCGSMAVLLNKQPSSHETCVDLHGDLINLAMVIASEKAPLLHDRLQRTLFAEPLYDTAKALIVASDPQPPAFPDAVTLDHVDRAYAYFICSWMGRNGVAGTRSCNFAIAVRFTPGGGAGGIRFSSAVDSLPAWHQRLRRCIILQRDMFQILEKIDDVEGTVIYCDPPYFKSTRGGEVYDHDFDESSSPLFGRLDDHGRLAEMLQRFRRARVIVSYYDDPRLRELYPKWTHRLITRPKSLSIQNKRGGVPDEAREVLIINGPSYTPSNSLQTGGAERRHGRRKGCGYFMHSDMSQCSRCGSCGPRGGGHPPMVFDAQMEPVKAHKEARENQSSPAATPAVAEAVG